MPIFEFRCMKCGNVFEMLFTSPNHEADLSCPECHGTNLERVVSTTNYVMGTGKGGKKAKISTKSCGPANSCMTLDLPGYTK